uniref:Uncharacterized protein n=1 Tax=Anguilla anguilla TaxID=7936 RepID=A0A0E9R894_ANGAN
MFCYRVSLSHLHTCQNSKRSVCL